MSDKVDLIGCKIRLAGDIRTVVVRDEHRPVTHPELELLRFMHGERHVFDEEVIGERVTTAQEEVGRLQEKYGANKFTEVFPGARPVLPMKAPKSMKRKAPAPAAKKSPLPELSE